MNTRSYRLRLLGLPESEGQLKVSTLRSLMDALQLVAERSIRLAAKGNATGSGPCPSWLVAATDFTVVGLSRGSTILHLEAPCLGDAVHDQVRESDLQRDSLSPHDTALDLVAEAVEEIRNGSTTGSRVDNSVRQAVLNLADSVGHLGVRYELESRDARGKGFVLDRRICQEPQVDTLTGHAPRSCILSGRIELIPQKKGKLGLFLDSGECLTLHVNREKVILDGFSFFFDSEATVEGIVSFGPDGRACSFEARRIKVREGAVREFEKLSQHSKISNPEFQKRASSCDVSSLIGIWPGDETIEELMALLD